MLVKLCKCGKGCFIGNLCLAVTAYADDIVLLAPTASAMRHLLSLCDDFAAEYDILFNASKSKCIYFAPCNIIIRSVTKIPRPVFYIGGKAIDYVKSWPHLGHVLNENNDDSDDIINRRNILIGQINNVLCYFGKLDATVKCKLLYSYCSGFYGCELWRLKSPQLQSVGATWRRALKRIWQLPYNTHGDILNAICGKWSIDDEICRRQIRLDFLKHVYPVIVLLLVQ